MIILGLTGSIGMGKSVTSGLFAEAGAPVFDSDAAVHALYGPGGAAVAPVEAAFPGVTRQGAVDRVALAARVVHDTEALHRLEALVHPLVEAERSRFLNGVSPDAVVVFDVPLLFETGGDAQVDATVVVSAPPDVQRQRVLARPGMTEAKFAAIAAKQMPDAEKRARADFVVDTGRGLETARRQVLDILEEVRRPAFASRRPRP